MTMRLRAFLIGGLTQDDDRRGRACLYHVWVMPRGQVLRDRFRARTDMNLFVDMLSVHADGVQTDAQDVADFLVEITFCQQRQDLPLALAQLVQVRRSAGLIEITDDFPRD